MALFHEAFAFEDYYDEEDMFSESFLRMQRAGVCLIRLIEFPDYGVAHLSSRLKSNVAVAIAFRYLKEHFGAFDLVSELSDYEFTGKFTVTFLS